LNYRDKTDSAQSVNQITTYHEKKIGKTLFRVTSVYTGKIDLKKALEDLIVRRILRKENTEGCGN